MTRPQAGAGGLSLDAVRASLGEFNRRASPGGPGPAQTCGAPLRAHLTALLAACEPIVNDMDRGTAAWSAASDNCDYARRTLDPPDDALLPEAVRTWQAAHACTLLLSLLDHQPTRH